MCVFLAAQRVHFARHTELLGLARFLHRLTNGHFALSVRQAQIASIERQIEAAIKGGTDTTALEATYLARVEIARDEHRAAAVDLRRRGELHAAMDAFREAKHLDLYTSIARPWSKRASWRRAAAAGGDAAAAPRGGARAIGRDLASRWLVILCLGYSGPWVITAGQLATRARASTTTASSFFDSSFLCGMPRQGSRLLAYLALLRTLERHPFSSRRRPPTSCDFLGEPPRAAGAAHRHAIEQVFLLALYAASLQYFAENRCPILIRFFALLCGACTNSRWRCGFAGVVYVWQDAVPYG